MDGPIWLAFAAGTLAAVNPCGFALLPAYLTFLILGDRTPGRFTAVLRALLMTGWMTLGFAAVFGVFGLVVAPVAGSIQQHLPWFSIVLGLFLAGLGGWLAAGRSMPGFSLQLGRSGSGGRIGDSLWSAVGFSAWFGASYAIASLGCTIGPFLGVVVAGFGTSSLLEGVLLFIAYAIGMGVVVGCAAVAVALARTSVIDRMRRIGAVLPRVAGALLVVIGAYVAYYGWFEIRVFSGVDMRGDPIIRTAEHIQTWLAGNLPWLGLATVLVIIASLLVRRLRRQRGQVEDDTYESPAGRDFLE